MAILHNNKLDCECWWCSATRQPDFFEDEQYFVTPDNRTICETCVEQNDWILTEPGGVMMWAYCNEIKLHWQKGA